MSGLVYRGVNPTYHTSVQYSQPEYNFLSHVTAISCTCSVHVGWLVADVTDVGTLPQLTVLHV